MRRKDREITDIQEIKEILDRALVLRIAFYDGEYPYILPLHYGYELDEENHLIFYMHGATVGHKMDLIKESPKVGFELDTDIETVSGGEIACKYGSTYSSVIGGGQIEVVEETKEQLHGLDILMKTQTGRSFAIPEEMLKVTAVFKFTVHYFTAKARKKMPTIS